MDGLKFNGEAFTNSVNKAIAEKIEISLKHKLQPFLAEIEIAGGEVTFNITNNLDDMSLSFKDIPDDLMKRISEVLS